MTFVGNIISASSRLKMASVFLLVIYMSIPVVHGGKTRGLFPLVKWGQIWRGSRDTWCGMKMVLSQRQREELNKAVADYLQVWLLP